MPMIDIYAPRDLFPDGTDRKLAEALTLALLRAEGEIGIADRLKALGDRS